MYLTHIDEEGNDSPAILIEGSTAANRAVNLPEFVNIPPGGLAKIEAPAAEFYARFDRAWELSQKGQFEAAIPAWRSALELNPDDARANNNLGFALARQGRVGGIHRVLGDCPEGQRSDPRGPQEPCAGAGKPRGGFPAKRQCGGSPPAPAAGR